MPCCITCETNEGESWEYISFLNDVQFALASPRQKVTEAQNIMSLKVPKSNNLQLFKDGYKVCNYVHLSSIKLMAHVAPSRN